MFELKRLSSAGIEAALEKVERYRLLNEPWEAESICLDILEVDPDNQEAIIGLVLARTDQFGSERGATVADAREVLSRLDDEYERLYYTGLVCERQAGMHLHRNATGDGPIAYDWLRQAMAWYEKAEALRPAGNDDPILRWNTCARTIMQHEHVRPRTDSPHPVMLE
ncbi:MAG: hypothetical protein L0271_20435 [Gemmatimonadetes bacterium]|nr:hypothetical protein [Gemmatimonadota bacterium]